MKATKSRARTEFILAPFILTHIRLRRTRATDKAATPASALEFFGSGGAPDS
jgi:hypothetical protein